MALPADSIVEVRWIGQALQQTIMFLQHYRVSGNTSMLPTPQVLEDTAEWFGDITAGAPPDILVNLLAFYPTGYHLKQVQAQMIFPTRVAYGAFYCDTPGSGGAGPLTANVCATFTLTSAKAGRKQVAKYHLGPLPDSKYADGLLTVPGMTNLENVANSATNEVDVIFSDATDMELTPTIFHRQINANPRYDDVELYRLNNCVRTQRRRTIGIGI